MAVFLESEQAPAVVDGRRVVGAATPSAHARVVRVWIAIQPVQRAARAAFVSEPFGADVTLPEVDVAVLESQQPHHAVAAEKGVVPQHGRILRIRDALVPRAVDFRRHGALDHEVVDVAFDARRRVVAAEIHRVGKWMGHVFFHVTRRQ